MKVMVADYHVLFREGLCHILAQLTPPPTIVQAGNFEDAIKIAKRESGLDVVFLDLTMPGGPWDLALDRLHQLLPKRTRIVIVTASDDPRDVKLAISLGASGFIPKKSSSKIFLSALGLIIAGEVYVPQSMVGDLMSERRLPTTKVRGVKPLTPRQREVLELLKQGWKNKEIAARLNITDGTVKLHVTEILRRLQVKSRMSAAMMALQIG